MDFSIENLPIEITREITKFLIPESKNIIFNTISSNAYVSSYSSRYEKAFFKNKMVKNNKGIFLSRISKKNNKHRYYLTKEIIDTIEVEYNDRLINQNYYEYKSKYVGKNIDEALIKLMLLY
jgi:hypothetical protein